MYADFAKEMWALWRDVEPPVIEIFSPARVDCGNSCTTFERSTDAINFLQ